ncbi:MAG: hypothetical protein KKF62_10850 [Bacteroidetes bacterium]|nr:hypothetical protein [Bacteroidota bacterium]MBU1116967.1 hypothetical protein [Bacteroidota bacterium]MBU1799140.1 hypothetical protein [Bacteroidota bacterium]
MKPKLSIKSALVSGFVATIAMTAFTFMAPLMGFEMDIPKMLAGTMGAPIVVGWLAHFMIGEILAIFFAILFLAKTNTVPDVINGALFGIIPWLVAQIMLMPMMTVMAGAGFMAGLFSGSAMVAMASLVGHLIYGAILGTLYKPQILSDSKTK